jgi:crossover junction endodeoxyribonuclease RuvC
VLILGIDPGTAVTGYGLVRGEPLGPYTLVECGVIRTQARDPLSARLLEIYDGIRSIVQRHAPSALAVEDVFYGKNVRTTVTLGHARGVVLLAGEQAQVPIHEFSPASVKKGVVGTGAASKEQVQFMVARLLRLKNAPSPSDAADGVAVALCCLMEGPRLSGGTSTLDAGRRNATMGALGPYAARVAAGDGTLQQGGR